jgi:hypothetical protein
MKFQKVKPKWNVEKLYAVRQKAENFVEGNCWDGMWNWGCESAVEEYQ